MKRIHTEYSLSEVPELEVDEFEFSASGSSSFDDANDDGFSGGSISIDALNGFSDY